VYTHVSHKSNLLMDNDKKERLPTDGKRGGSNFTRAAAAAAASITTKLRRKSSKLMNVSPNTSNVSLSPSIDEKIEPIVILPLSSAKIAATAAAESVFVNRLLPYPVEKIPLNVENADEVFTELGNGLHLGLKFIKSSDKELRSRAGGSLGKLLKASLNQKVHDDQLETPDELSTEELHALSILAISRIPSLRHVAGEVLGNMASHDGLPRGKLGLQKSLADAITMVQSENISLQKFAIEMAVEISNKGPIWRERLIEGGWLTHLVGILRKALPVGESKVKEDLKKSISESNTEDSGSDIPDKKLLFLRDEEKLVLKLIFELIRSLQLDETESSFSRRGQVEMTNIVAEHRVELVRLLVIMCSMCSAQQHTSILRLLFAALSGLLKNLSSETWPLHNLETYFVDSAIEIILSRTDAAVVEYQSVAAAVFSRASQNQETEYDDEEDPAEDDPDVPISIHNYRRSAMHSAQSESTKPYFSSHFEPSANEGKWAIATRNGLESSHMSAKLIQLARLMMESLRALRCACLHSKYIARSLAEAFEVHGLMGVMNVLFRSQVPGAKIEIAEFLSSLCSNISDSNKISLCESGIIVRLIRLASPSSVYEGVMRDTGLVMSDEAAFVPAIRALCSLASVDVIGARIIIAGGLGPLYSHANSSRPSRAVAKETLDVLGVTNINDLVSLWKSHKDEVTAEVSTPPSVTSPTHHGRNNSQRGLKKFLSVGNSTRNFFHDFSKQPRAGRIHKMLSTWVRNDGSPLMMDASLIRGDSDGDTPFNNADILGSGAFSTVYKGYIKKTDACRGDAEDGEDDVEKDDGPWISVAVKQLTEAAFADDSFMNEIKVLSKVPAHRHITNIHMVAFYRNTVLIVSELGGPKTLSYYLSANDNSQLCSSWVARLKVLGGIADALKTLQSMTPVVLHLDIKSCNILITDLGNGRYLPKLCDFGLAVELKQGYGFLSPANHGTLQWMAPEVMRDEETELSKGYDQSADTFSFAVLMWEMAHPGRVPWDELAVDVNLNTIQERIKELVCSGRRLNSQDPHLWPKGYEQLMRSCWRQNPSMRPAFVRSFLTDPDSLFGAQKNKQQETIGVTLKRIMWEHKSANRISRSQEAKKPVRVHASKLRRQSSIVSHQYTTKGLEHALDYHDHDFAEIKDEDDIKSDASSNLSSEGGPLDRDRHKTGTPNLLKTCISNSYGSKRQLSSSFG